MLPLAATVLKTIERYEMLRRGDRIAVAVSGGADSVALLRLMDELRDDLGVILCVAHFNHQLRGADSDADEKFAALLARERGLEFVVDRKDVAAEAKNHGWNLEDAARRLRYGFFAEIVARGAARVATAHTADDQAETILARLIRGTGLTGLASIYPVRGTIIRPVLEVRREALRCYLARVKQEWREDATNADTRRLRARVRQRLLPEMEQNFSKSIVSKLSELAELARENEAFWATLVEDRYRDMVERTNTGVSMQTKDLLWPMGAVQARQCSEQHPFRALTQRLIRRVYAEIATTGGELSRKHVEQVIRLAERGSSGQRIELPGYVGVRKRFDHLVFGCVEADTSAPPRPLRKTSYAYDVKLPTHGSAAITVPELGRTFYLKVIDWPLRERETTYEGVVLDAGRLRAPLVLRNWKPGDAYCPSGRTNQRKVARMLIAGRIDVAQRALWPVLTSAGQVAWADRMPVAKEFSASEATRTGLWIAEDVG
jgi:tRNA(Ile)-lysidine synthase